MDLENLNFKAKDMVSFVVYIVTLTIFFMSMSAKVDKVSESVDDLKAEKREVYNETKASSSITQNDIKALMIRAELNRQSIEIIKIDLQNLKADSQKNN